MLHNAKILGVNLYQVSTIFISHGHYDHAGGLIPVLTEIRKNLNLFIHPYAFYPKYKVNSKTRYVGISFKKEELRNLVNIIESRKPLRISQDIMSSGEITRETDFEEIPSNFYVKIDGDMIRDTVLDDIALIIEHKRGLIIITGCGHAGIINTVLHARKITGNDKIYAIIGGFHLINAKDNVIRKTVKHLSKLNPEIVIPLHCTGFKAVETIDQEMGEKLILAHTGDKIVL